MAHAGNLRDLILKKSLEVLESRGAEELSLREIAREIDVSTAAPYKHFPDGRAQVLDEVVEEGFRNLDEAMREATLAAQSNGAWARDGVGMAYLDFARKRPRLFALMFGDPGKAANPARDSAFARLSNAIRIDQAAGLCEPGDVDVISLDSWVRAHGLATLLNAGQIEPRLPAGLDVDGLTQVVFRIAPTS
ncbi:MAG: TetR/AcrR family transcriptional regulator [Phenylobacterium sp.]